MEKTVQISLGDRITIVKRVTWSTTAKDIIRSVMKDKIHLKGYIFLEEWHGCVRQLKNEEQVLKVLGQWGLPVDEEVPVRLKIIRRSQYFRSPTNGQSRKKHGGGRVASKKRRTHKKKSMRGYLKEMDILNQKLIKGREDITKLTVPEKPKKVKLTLPIDLSTLPPELEDECIALQEEYEEERKENSDLVRRKEELTSNILSQRNEMETLMETISSLESQVLNEQHKLNRVIETSASPELAKAQKEISELQSELKVRTKLNQLQSAKLRELVTTTENTEQEILEYTKKYQAS